jgi:cell division protein FtsW
MRRPAGTTVSGGSHVRELRPPSRRAERAVAITAPDWLYIGALVALISVGMIMVYSTTVIDGPQSLMKMAQWIGLGVPVMLVATRLPMAFWRKLAPWLLLGSFVALASLLLKEANPLAIGAKGAYRWLKVPGLGQVQPSEFAKLAFVLFAARFLERRGQKMRSSDWIAFVLVLGALAGVIYKEPDLGTALVLAGIAFCMLVAAGVSWRVLIQGVLVLALVVGVLAWNTEHQRARLLSWWNPWAPEHRQEGGYQVIQSFSAMARGGLWGVGLGQSIHKIGNRLPEAHTDFIFAIVAEEMGLLRAAGVLILFGILAWRGYSIAARAPDRYSALVAVGVTSWIAVQSCLNVAVVTGTVPNTGVPLPFISSGGSSLLALMAATGIVIGISRRRQTEG